jgi:hypothetical protein
MRPVNEETYTIDVSLSLTLPSKNVCYYDCRIRKESLKNAHIREMRNLYEILIGKPEVKTLLVTSRRRGEDNIKTNLKEIGCKNVDLMNREQQSVL